MIIKTGRSLAMNVVCCVIVFEFVWLIPTLIRG
jgi:hypothetical protein